MVTLIESKEQYKEKIAAAGDKLLVVDFFATWCGPCRQIAPKLQEWATSMVNVLFIKVDVDEAEELAEEEGVTAMPTFVFYRNGKKLESFTGADAGKLQEKIEALSK